MSKILNNRPPITDETRKRMSKASKGRTLSKESRNKVAEAQRGRIHSIESKEKISKALKGRKISEKRKKELSIEMRGENNPLSKISENTAKMIKKDMNSMRNCEIIIKYGVSKSIVTSIRNGRTWKWI